jgi:hypothetical protein
MQWPLKFKGLIARDIYAFPLPRLQAMYKIPSSISPFVVVRNQI